MTDRVLASKTTEPLGDAAEIARLMGLRSWRRMSSLSLVDQIERGLPLQAAERIAQAMAPDNPRAKYTLLSHSTWSRLRKRPRRHLTRESSERVHRVARVLLEARRLWADDDSAMVRFLNRPHLLLAGVRPSTPPGHRRPAPTWSSASSAKQGPASRCDSHRAALLRREGPGLHRLLDGRASARKIAAFRPLKTLHFCP